MPTTSAAVRLAARADARPPPCAVAGEPRCGARALVVLAIGAFAAPTARAQAGTDDDRAGGPRWTVGIGAIHAPSYDGSDDDRTRALPIVNYRDGRFFAGAMGGIGCDFSTIAGVQFGPVVSYRPGRDEDDAARLRGLGDIDAGADIGGFVRWNLNPFSVHATVRHGISGDAAGARVRLGTGWGVALTPSDRLVVDASVDWADSDVMQGWFGVTATQSARSGLAAYTAGSGVRRYGVGAAWTHTFTPQWFSSVGVAAWRLGDDAAASPITVDRNAAAVSVGVGHRF